LTVYKHIVAAKDVLRMRRNCYFRPCDQSHTILGVSTPISYDGTDILATGRHLPAFLVTF